jgi:hypothetical protein
MLKLSVKSGKDDTGPLFGHIGDEISKNRGKNKIHWVSRGHETEFGAKLSLPCPFFS